MIGQKEKYIETKTTEYFRDRDQVKSRLVPSIKFDLFFRNVENFHIRAGSSQYYEKGTIYTIEKVVVHPRFSEISRDFDVGLLKVFILLYLMTR